MRFELKNLLKRDRKFKKFIRLGNLKSDSSQDEIRAAGIWGTLGWGDDSVFSPKKEIEFSETYNTKFNGATAEFVSELNSSLPEILNHATDIKERYINFDSIELEMNKTWTRKYHRNLRLSVFLEPNEHAIAFYQYAKSVDYSKPENQNYDDPDAFLEFIPGTLDKTKKQINFLFEPIPKKKIRFRLFANKIGFEETHEEFDTSFIIKVISFKRSISDDSAFYAKSLEKLALAAGQNTTYLAFGEKRYGLYMFNPKNQVPDDVCFEDKKENYGGCLERILPKEAQSKINPNVKTLLLIHGTFVDSYSTFKDFFYKDSVRKKSFLQDMINLHGYEQILAFDHPSLSVNVAHNVDHLLQTLMPDVSFGNNAIDVIACSRGGLVAESLASHPKAKNRLHLNKVVLFSPANGVGYLDTVDKIALWLSVFRRISPHRTGKIIAALLASGVEFISKMPGLKDMKPDSLAIKDIMAAKPNNPNMTYKNIISDWDISLNESKFKRVLGWLDVKIKKHLGEQHDWVVGCEYQKLYPKKAKQDQEPKINSIHCKYLQKNYSKRNGQIVDTHKIILDFLTN